MTRWLVAGLLSVMTAGCASSPPTTPTADRSDPLVRSCLHTAGSAPWQGVARAENGTVSIDAVDDYFAAGCVVVPWNREVRMTVTNRGHLQHDVTISALGLRTSVDAGQTVFITLPATKVPLRFLCSYHVPQQMFGAIVPMPRAKEERDVS